MKRLNILISLITTIALGMIANDTKVYILPINDEIGSMTWQHTRHACEEAKAMDADILLVHLNL